MHMVVSYFKACYKNHELSSAKGGICMTMCFSHCILQISCYSYDKNISKAFHWQSIFLVVIYWLESSNYRLEKILGGHLVQRHARSRSKFAIWWCVPRPSLVKLCISLGAGMLQSLSAFLCSAVPCEKNFLSSFKRQVRKHLFPVFQKSPGVSWTLHSLGIAVHMPGDKDNLF